ncbi:MAG TPA: Crp/Fnr family transcriptional regulator [Polyangiaceae bacterium]|nr:Crp/Fnr family transcriptional regulator [Polyangiaceae bacterium]
MNREQVWKAASDSLRASFGRLLDVRDVRRVRRVAGEAWVVTVALASSAGDLHVADVAVDDSGAMTPTLTADHVIEAVRRAERASRRPPVEDALGELGELANLAAGGDDELGLDVLSEAQEPVEKRVEGALASGDADSLAVARVLLPRLLADHARRGATLFTMAEVEVKLGEPSLARGYLEAAAREFADRFDLPALEKTAALELQLAGADAFSGSPVRTLLERSRARLRPIEDLFEARSLAALSGDARRTIGSSATLRTLSPAETLVSEGDPARSLYVVKSGLLGVWLEKPSGGSWLVRCCFPGWLLGESSVLGGADARCAASLRAERVSEVWTLDAAAVRAIMDADEAFARTIAETKQVHRIDSFFSMHETMGQLDVQVRDDVLSCIQRLESFEEETTLLPAGVVPRTACLVARGSIALFEGDDRRRVGVVEPDSFYGVRDAIHRIAPAVSAVAMPHTTVAFFDAERLQRLCERSPEHVVAVLERLG